MAHLSPDVVPPPLPGDVVGGYVLGEVLGVGGMATVYRAHDEAGQLAAVKVLHPGRTDDEEARRFKREFLTLRALRHEGVVSVYAAGRAGQYPWIAMEYVAGQDLETQIGAWVRRPPSDRIGLVERIFRDLCGALAYVHSQGLIHRDLKPSNVLVTPDHRAKLTDFGVVKAPFGQFHTQLTQAGSLVGTAAYMSPEQISGDPVDGRSDLYSLGAVLYVMLTGARPIMADSVAGYLRSHLHDTPRDPRELDPRIPARLSRICLRLLAKDPAQRYASADQVLTALDEDEGSDQVAVHGREAELEVLLARADRNRPGEGALVVVAGEPGSGRSTLLRDFVERGRAAGHGISYAATAGDDLLEVLCQQIPSLGPAGGTGTAAQRIAVRAAGRPWVMVVDDLDRASARAISELTGLVRQQVAIEGDALLVVVAIHRPVGEVAAFASGASTGISPELVELSALSTTAIRGILRDRGLGGAACAVLAQRLAAEGDRWPGKVLERLATLESAGWLARDAHGQLVPHRGLEMLRLDPLPASKATVQAEATRLDPMERDVRRVLEAIVVAGGELDPATLSSLLDLPAHVVERASLRLLREGMVEQEAVGTHPVLRLAPDHPVEALLPLVAAPTRRALHRALAAELSRRRGRAPIEELAHHLLRGGQPEAAWPLLLRAASVVAHSGDIDRAGTLLDEAEEAGRSARDVPPDEAATRRRTAATLRAELFEQAGELAKARTAWSALRDRCDHPPTITTARTALVLLDVAEQPAPSLLPELRALSRQVTPGDPRWPALTLAHAEVRLAAGETGRARKLVRSLADVAREVRSPILVARARMGIALMALASDNLRRAATRLDEATDALRALPSGLPQLLARCLVWSAEVALAGGHLVAAREHALEAARAVPGLPHAAALVALTHSAAGDDALVASFAESAASGAAEDSLSARAAAIRALLAAERLEEARALLVEPDASTPPGLDDPVGQLLALHARLAPHPDDAAAFAWSALGRDLPAFSVSAARIALDAAHGLARIADPAAEEAVCEALERAAPRGLALLRLDAARLGRSLRLVGRDDLEALRDQVASHAGHPEGFAERWS